MKRPFRTGVVAGLLALTLAGAACGSGSTPEAQKPATNNGAVSNTTPVPPETTAPAAVETTAPAAVSPTTGAAPAAPRPAAPKPTVTTAKPTTTTTTAKPAEHVILRLGYF